MLFCCGIVGACRKRRSAVDDIGGADHLARSFADERDLATDIAVFLAHLPGFIALQDRVIHGSSTMSAFMLFPSSRSLAHADR